ncbi:MAG: PadR family transcriptional regulator [Actinomycetia bacterium]|nr:PadR family transcriptional regulator [Actinomycetes bacterium]
MRDDHNTFDHPPFARPFGRGRRAFGLGLGPEGPLAYGLRGSARRARRGAVRASILALLAEQPLNGYQIMNELSERTQGAWQVSPGAVYPCLAQLADEGLIEPTDGERRITYRLTTAGQAAAAEAGPEPWAGRSYAGRDDTAVRALWDEIRQLLAALNLAGSQATPDQLIRLRDDVAALRRHVLGLLATPPADQ